MIFTGTGNAVFTNAQYVELTCSAGYTSYAGPPAAGDARAITMPVAGQWSNAIVDTAVAAPVGGWTFTLYIDNVATALVLTIAATTKRATFTGTPINSAAGSFVVWRLGGAVAGLTSAISISIEFTPNT